MKRASIIVIPSIWDEPFGLVAAELNNQFGIDQDVYVAELNWDKLTQNAFSKNIQFSDLFENQYHPV